MKIKLPRSAGPKIKAERDKVFEKMSEDTSITQKGFGRH